METANLNCHPMEPHEVMVKIKMSEVRHMGITPAVFVFGYQISILNGEFFNTGIWGMKWRRLTLEL